jgi:hypothetical protein
MGQDARDFINEIWPHCAEYLDSDLRHDARQDFHQRWWELYLAHALLSNGITLLSRQHRPLAKKGPDLLATVEGKKIWIEAVTASAGTGPDAVPERVLGVAAEVPDNQIKLRIQSALSSKLNKYRHYRSQGWISESEGYVVAVNAGRVPKARLERTVPRIVACVFPIGVEVVHLNIETGKFSDLTYQYQGSVEKVTGVEVPTDSFLDTECSGITAVLYSNSDAFNRPLQIGHDFIMVHNPLASIPFPRSVLRAGLEYHAELTSDGRSFSVHRTAWAAQDE